MAFFPEESATGPGSATPALLRQINGRKIVAALRRHGRLTRAGLARHTGFSHPTVTKIVDALRAANILEEGDPVQPALGRPSTTVGLATRTAQVISLVVGTNRCSLIPAGLDGSLRDGEAEIFATPGSYRTLLNRVTKLVKQQSTEGAERILGLGVCLPGLLDADREKSLLCPNLTWLEGKRPTRDLEKRLGVPAAATHAMTAHYLFESHHGGARGMDDFVVVNYAGGLGAAACSGGKLVSGNVGLAGELGHITVDAGNGELCGCGNRGCLETVASDRAVAEAASARAGETLTIDEAIVRVRSGDDSFDEVLERAARYLGIGLAAAVNLFNPRAIFLYGKFLGARADLFDLAVASAGERALGLSFAQCEFFHPQRDPHHCQQIGAAAAIIERLTDAATAGADDKRVA